jgi:hypothetical protein
MGRLNNLASVINTLATGNPQTFPTCDAHPFDDTVHRSPHAAITNPLPGVPQSRRAGRLFALRLAHSLRAGLLVL